MEVEERGECHAHSCRSQSVRYISPNPRAIKTHNESIRPCGVNCNAYRMVKRCAQPLPICRARRATARKCSHGAGGDIDEPHTVIVDVRL